MSILKVLMLSAFLVSCATHHAPKRFIASTESYTPQAAIEDASSSPLKFVGWAILPGSDTVGSCVFSNDKAYVIWHLCSKSKKEMPAFSLDIISYEGGKVNFYVENSEKVEKTKGNTSKLLRSDYDANWAVSFIQTPEPKMDMNLIELKNYLNSYGRPAISKGDCFAGGMFQKLNLVCRNGAAGLEQIWGEPAKEFWTEPGESYYELIKHLRLRTSQMK
jgi:hypothetical protein